MSRLERNLFIANLAFAAALLVACIILQIMVANSPRWQARYWADVRDFVQGSDGTVYVAQLNERVLRYDRSGKYLDSYRTGFMIDMGRGSDVQLAVDTRGRIYLKIDRDVRVYTPDWKEYSGERFTGDTCRLSASGHIEDADTDSRLLLHNRPVAPGELLFSWRRRSGERDFFRNRDGGVPLLSRHDYFSVSIRSIA